MEKVIQRYWVNPPHAKVTIPRTNKGFVSPQSTSPFYPQTLVIDAMVFT